MSSLMLVCSHKLYVFKGFERIQKIEFGNFFMGFYGGGDILSFNFDHIYFQKSHSTSASGVVSSGDFRSSTTSPSKSLCLSTENIDIVLKQCFIKYKKELIESAQKELEQLKTYVRKFSNKEEMVNFCNNLCSIKQIILFSLIII